MNEGIDMKLKVMFDKQERYLEIDFWSFTKCMFWSNVVLNLILYGIILLFAGMITILMSFL